MASNQEIPDQQPESNETRTLKRVVIKEEFVALTGDHIKAVILAQLEYWQKRVKDFDKFIEEEKRRAESSGEEVIINETYGWIYKDALVLADETMLHLGKTAMSGHLAGLVEAGWLLRRKNPNYKWDKTYQYRLDLYKIRDDLEILGYQLQDWILPANPERSNSEHRSSESEHRNSESGFREPENRTAIPETTVETTTERDLPSVDPSTHDTRPREDNTVDSETRPTERLTERPTDENSSDQTSESYSSVQLLEPENAHHDEEQAPDLSPKEDDKVAPKPDEALRQQVEAIPTSEVSEDARQITGEILRDLPALSERDQLRTARLAEHYQRLKRTSVLRIAASGVALYATQQRIRHPFSYLLACCVDAEGERSEGDEDLLASLSRENSTSPSAESELAGYESFLGSDDQESNAGEDEQRQHTPEPDSEALAVWERVLEDVSGEINAPSLRVWFEGTIPVSLCGETLTVSVPNSFAKEYIESRFVELLEGALAKRLSPTSSLEIVVGVEGLPIIHP